MNRQERTSRVFYGWYVVAAVFIMLFLNAAAAFMIGVMVKPMAADFDWSRSAISAAIFLNFAVYALALLLAGRLYDLYGPRWVVAGSTVLFAAGYALMATMGAYWQFLLYYGVIAAAGMGGSTVPLFGSIIGRWFEKRRGLVVSLAFAGNCIGQFLLVPVYSDLITISGWRATCLWMAALSGVIGLILTFVVLRGDPWKLGLQPYGASDRGDQVVRLDSTSAPRAAAPRGLTIAEAMRTRSLWMFAILMFFCGGGDYFVATHLVPMVTDYGISTATASNMLAWLGLMSLVGILIAGPASDAIGNKLPIATTFVLRIIVFVMLLKFKGVVPFWIFSLTFGVTLMVTAPLTPTLVSALYGVTHIGFISGFVTTLHMVGAGLFAYLGGLIFDKTDSYNLALLISAVLAAVALVCTLLIREKRHVVDEGADGAPGRIRVLDQGAEGL
ncbi:MAG: MFS transporter [Thermoleophilia bacterium]